MKLNAVRYGHVVEVVSSQTQVAVSCTENWNGCKAGQWYQLRAVGGDLYVDDEMGLATKITQEDAIHFEVVTELPPENGGVMQPMHAVLRELVSSLNDRHHFADGDMVCWKDGLSNRRIPDYGQPAIVTEVLSEPVMEDAVERMDVKIAVMHLSRGEVVLTEILVDSRRLRPYIPGVEGDFELKYKDSIPELIPFLQGRLVG